MHYGKKAFSKNGGITIQTLDPSKQDIIGKRSGVSVGDIQLVKEMYGCGKGTVELLYPVTATQSSTWQDDTYDGTELIATKCVDGNIEGQSVADQNMCHTKNEPSPWLAIDYGTPVTVNRVEIFNREDCCGDRTKNIDVRVSNELPTSAIEMFSGGSPLGHFAGPATNGQRINITGQVVVGRYVIIQMDNGEGVPLNLKEVRAYGLQGDVELLQPSTASQSSTYQDGGAYDGTEFPASKCIDGDIEGHSLVDRNMCHTQNEPSPWLAIDYRTRIMVNRVEIFNREACCGESTKNVYVRVSNELPTSANEMFSGGSLLGHFAGPAFNGQRIVITGRAAVGRYVIVQMDNGEDSALNLKEVRAFGAILGE